MTDCQCDTQDGVECYGPTDVDGLCDWCAAGHNGLPQYDIIRRIEGDNTSRQQAGTVDTGDSPVGGPEDLEARPKALGSKGRVEGPTRNDRTAY